MELVQAIRAVRGGGRAAGSCVASCGAAAEHLGCLPGKPSSSLERWPGWAGQVGWLVGDR